mmetsp:Transcript_21614/g.26553  ORF Transcript_21614/g.26553 Transcript_21614/m.26553 type:complete len:99 (+) Transcript_21614:79-375(+)
MAQQHYDLCLYRCDEKVSDTAGHCKQACFKNILVPYHMIKHQAQDSEENLYRQCLAGRLPNITQKDYVACTNNIYSQRVELMMAHYANSAEKILSTIH